jgi:peroxiredoxin
MKSRVLMLPLAAIAISGLCLFRVNRPSRPSVASADVGRRPAPRFELYDQHSRLVRFDQRFASRQTTVLVFFNPRTNAGMSQLRELASLSGRLHQNGIAVVGVSPLLPQEHRRLAVKGREIPFVLLSDFDLSVHKLWNRLDARGAAPVPGVFLVDRAGHVPFDAAGPAPAASLAAVLAELNLNE